MEIQEEKICTEREVAHFIDSILGVVCEQPKAQHRLYNIIRHLDDGTIDDDDVPILKHLLDVVMAFSFICKDHQDKFDKFIVYHQKLGK